MRIPAFLLPLPDAPVRLEGEARDNLYKATRTRVLSGLTIVYAFFYTTRSVLDVVKKPLIDAHIYNADQLGTLGTCLLGAYAVGKLFLTPTTFVTKAPKIGGKAFADIHPPAMTPM